MEKKGYKILERNVHFKIAELDIVAKIPNEFPPFSDSGRVDGCNPAGKGGASLNRMDPRIRGDDRIAIIEVRSRAYTEFGRPETSVDMRKQRQIIRASNIYLTRFNPPPRVRFDIIAIVANGKSAKIKHFLNAFVDEYHDPHYRRRSANPWQAY